MVHESKSSDESSSSSTNLDDENDEETDHISRLPDELLLLIFNKLCDAKCLCNCNLVSKRFNSIIPQTQSVSLIIPQQNPKPNNLITSPPSNQNFPKRFFSFVINNVLSKPFQYLQSKPPTLRFDADLFRSAVESLKRFQNIQDLRIEFPFFQRNESLIEWHAEFGRDLNICFILFASSMKSKRKPNEDHEFDDGEFVLTNQLLQSRINAANQCFREATWRRHILRHVVEDLGIIEKVEITDSKRKGKVRLNEKQLMDLVDPWVKIPSSGYGKLWHVQVVEIPSCELTLYGATVVVIRRTYDFEDEDGVGGGDNSGIRHLIGELWFKDEEQVLLREVLLHICDNNLPSTSLDINVRR